MRSRAAFALSWALAACGGTPPAASPAEPAEPAASLDDVLPTPATYAANFTWRQRLTATYEDQELTFQAIVEKSGDSLSLLFLAPYGSRALLVQQTGGTVNTQYFVEQRLPFPARYVLSDVHRVFLRGFTDAPRPDGRHARDVDGEWFRDTWRGGRLERREVSRGANAPQAAVVIEYTGGHTSALPSERVVLDNRAHGYRIVIETVR